MKNAIIIAEAGVNHNGSLEVAKKLIDIAAEAGVDYVKFQTFKSELLVSKTAVKAEYQQRNLKDSNNSQYDMLKKLELTPEQHLLLIDYCKDKGVKFLSTAFDLESVDFLIDLHLGIWKIPSGEITNYPYLVKIAEQKEPVILSSGMSEYKDIEDAISVLLRNGVSKENLTVLHCNTEYPTSMKDVNLLAMRSIADRFDVKVGYSDHTLGTDVPIAAVALGASVIEKHFTLSREMEGPDHKASLEPAELINMVTSIRNIELALGNGVKSVSISEQRNLQVARKSIVAACHIDEGDVFTEHNLTVKRPGNGISPMRWKEVLGTVANMQYEPDDLILL